jgi:hypothetical protein
MKSANKNVLFSDIHIANMLMKSSARYALGVVGLQPLTN